MAKSRAVVNYFNFIGGLNTESNALTSPENTLSDCDNVDLLVDGSLRLRRSLVDHVLPAAPSTTIATPSVVGKTLYWDNAGGFGDIVVVLRDNSAANIVTAHLFWRNTTDLTATQGNAYSNRPVIQNYIIDIQNLVLGTNNLDNATIRATSMFGGLLITSDSGNPIMLRLTGTSANVTVNVSPVTSIRKRNYEPSTFDLESRTITTYLDYNLDSSLFNRGWDTHTLRRSTGLIVVSDLQQQGNAVLVNLYNGVLPSGIVNGTPVSLYINGLFKGNYTVDYLADPATLTYALINGPALTANEIGPTGGVNTYVVFKTGTTTSGYLPSKYDSPAYLINTNGVIDLNLWANQNRGATSDAPLGREIINILQGGTYNNTTKVIPSSCAFVNKRLWLAGSQKGELGNTIYFSQVCIPGTTFSDVTKSNTDAYKSIEAAFSMHTKNDPTHSVFFDPLPDDGGYITISEAGTFHHLEPFGAGVLAFSDRGIWYIGGTSGEAFSALAYTVKKISNLSVIGKVPVLTTPFGIFCITTAGIYLITTQDGFSFQEENITFSTINSLYTSLGPDVLKHASLHYDELEKELLFAYRMDPINRSITNKLVFDIRLKAWYKASYSPSLNIVDVLHTLDLHPNGSISGSALRVIRQVSGVGIEVASEIGVDTPGVDCGGVGTFSAFVETNPQIYNDSMRDKQIQWLELFHSESENSLGVPSSCLAQVKWDWTNDATSGKWTDLFETYKLDKYLGMVGNSFQNRGHYVITTRHKVTGTGRALAIRYEASPGKYMHILGWSLVIEGNTIV